ncbi:MAG: hypothetical protein KDD78_07510 [Caldilineaceae bacterium]|nr:hypothetical protein [Caldilineaceae bacterium]
MSRLALVLGVIMLVQAVLFGADTSAARAELIDWTNIPRSGGGNGWNNNGPSGVGASQTFVNIDGTDVDMVVSYSRFMWDNSSVPNIYGTDAPVIPLTSSLRFTNNINDSKSAPGSATGPTIITITFSEPILIDRMALVSLSQFISPSLPRYEWIEARAFDADANLLLATSVVGDSYDLNGSVVVRADSPLVLNDGSGVYFGRGTSIQSTSCPTTVGPCGYDRLTLKYQATPVQRIELVHFATLGGNVDDTRPTGTNGRTSIAIEGITFSVPQEVILYDWADAPDMGVGNGPGDYSTRNEDNGPSHVIIPELYLGGQVDAENDGQPTANANGDDNNPAAGPDDEDGVVVADLALTEGDAATVRVNATNLTDDPATLTGWIDFNGDGLFAAGEAASVAVPAGSAATQVILDFGTVPSDVAGRVYARFRLSTDDAAMAPTGPASDGEVEDYAVAIAAAPEFDWGDAPDSCLTTAANNGPSHGIVPGLTIGQLIDPEVDGQPNATATGDDTNNLDDEDGVAVTQLTVVEGGTAAITVNVVNTTGQAATLYGWIDLDNSGTFDPDERVEIAVPTGTNNVPFTLDFGAVPTGFTGSVCARFRLSTDDAAANPTGPATDGEVEDYQITIVAAPDYDWGDAPDTGAGIGAGNYATLAADNGPSHRIVETLYIGALVDAELDGQPNAAADGDDAAPAGAPDDEDGVTVADLTLVEGTSAAVRVTVTNLDSTPAVLYGWIDFDGNGQFDLEERSTVPVLANSTNVEVTLDFGSVPAAGITQTYARFRLSHDGAAAAPTGTATDGEVEDYLVVITSIYDWGDAPDVSPGTGQGEYNTLAGDNGPSHKIIAGLHMGTVVDGESDGQPNTAAAGDDLLPVGSLDDEDGVSGADLTMTAGDSALVNVSVTNLTTAGAVLYGWIDFNENGVFEPSESAQAEVPAGSNNITVLLDFGLVPSDDVVETYARFRLSTDNGASSPTGPAANGEVEDYIVTINTMPSAIDLVSLTGSYADDAITVRWTTAVELNTAGFHLYRNTSAARATAVRVTDALIPTGGLNGGDYRFVDDDVVTGVTYYYWLIEVESGVHADKEYGPVAIRAALPSSRTTFNIFLPLLATGAAR